MELNVEETAVLAAFNGSLASLPEIAVRAKLPPVKRTLLLGASSRKN